MDWTELIKGEIEHGFKVTEGLVDLLGEEDLDWKPSSCDNWMTTGQLLMHLAISCGTPMYGFVKGDWGLPEGVDLADLKAEDVGLPEGTDLEDPASADMLPPAEALPSVKSLAEAKENLAEDKRLALDMLAKCDEDILANEISKDPWGAPDMTFGRRFLGMTKHLNQHRDQFFYYLKLPGKPVDTSNLYP